MFAILFHIDEEETKNWKYCCHLVLVSEISSVFQYPRISRSIKYSSWKITKFRSNRKKISKEITKRWIYISMFMLLSPFFCLCFFFLKSCFFCCILQRLLILSDWRYAWTSNPYVLCRQNVTGVPLA